MNINCIICSDLLSQSEDIYFTKCGHVFHYHCLSQWLERSNTCPQCRSKMTKKCISRVYFNFANSDAVQEDATTLQSKLDNAIFQLREKEAKLQKKNDEVIAVNTTLLDAEQMVKTLQKKLATKESSLTAVKEQLDYVKTQNLETERLRTTNAMLEKSLNTLNGLQRVLNATSDDVEEMLQGYTDVRTIATFATALKKALVDTERQKTESRNKLTTLKAQLAEEKKQALELQNKVRQLEEKLCAAKLKIIAYRKEDRKRKSEDVSENCDRLVDGTQAKIRKIEDSSVCSMDDVSVVEDALERIPNADSPNVSTLLKRIEESDSPYLNLKQSSAAISAMHLREPLQNTNSFKPSEFAILKNTKSVSTKRQNPPPPLEVNTVISTPLSQPQPSAKGFSIFHHKKIMNKSLDLFEETEAESSKHETSYDGLGGHSKLDLFPVPIKAKFKSCVPKLTAKHRLKKPTSSSGSQDIGKLLERLKDK